MKRIKKFVLASLFLSLPIGAWAQTYSDFYEGISLPFFSNGLSSLGVAENLGWVDHYTISKKMLVFSEVTLLYGETGINYKTLDDNGNFAQSGSTPVGIGSLGLNIGASYFLVPKTFYVSASVYASYLSVEIPADDQLIGVQNPNTPSSEPIYLNTVLNNMNGLNYGVSVAAAVIFDNYQHSQLGLKFDLGLATFNPDLKNYKSSLNHIMLCYHYYMIESSLSQKYQNKLLK